MLHLDPSDTYGSAFGAFVESKSGVGWDVRSAAKDRDADGSGMELTEENTNNDEEIIDTNDIILPAQGAAIDARTCLNVTTYATKTNPPSASGRRSYSMDRAGPKLVLGSDKFIDHLVKSGAHKYCEFKQLDATYMSWGEEGGVQHSTFHPVPASRSEVFRDKTLSLSEKRSLMRMLKQCVRVAELQGAQIGSGDPDDANAAIGAPGSEWNVGGMVGGADVANAKDKTLLVESAFELFTDALARLGLPTGSKAAGSIQFALALCTHENELANCGFKRLTTYLASLGKYGPSVGAVLVPLYGTNGFPQAFSRVAAVAGATYVLRVGVRKVSREANGNENKNKITSVVTSGGQRLRCRALCVSADAWPQESKETQNTSQWTSRMTCVIDGAAIPEPEGAEQRGGATTLAVFPPGVKSENGVSSGAVTRVLQLSAATNSCPRGPTRVLHASRMSSDSSRTPENDLKWVLERLTNTEGLFDENKLETEYTEKPKALWVSFYRDAVPLDFKATVDSWSELPLNVVTLPGPDSSADFTDVVLVTEAAHTRLWGEDAGELFPHKKSDEGNAEEDGEGKGCTGNESDEDEIDALLRDLPGGIGASVDANGGV